MSRIISAGSAEHFRSCFCVDITQVLFVEKSTASVILAENMLFPVNIIVQAIAERTFKVLVLLQCLIVNHDLPSAQQVSGQAPAMQENSL